MALGALVSFTLRWMLLYARQLLFPSYVEITQSEQSLLGVRDDEIGFKLSPDKVQDRVSTPVLKYNTTSYHASGNMPYQSTGTSAR